MKITASDHGFGRYALPVGPQVPNTLRAVHISATCYQGFWS